MMQRIIVIARLYAATHSPTSPPLFGSKSCGESVFDRWGRAP
ncbi:hypothetical protein Z947_3602 [Sulfitobacter geojensis]|nr:hypothetical protein Z947_3602 [Sulfitobacter geojensis]